MTESSKQGPPRDIFVFDNGETPFHAYHTIDEACEDHSPGNIERFIEASYAKELEAEVERLKADNAKLHTITNNLSTYSNLRKEENERLKSERDAAVEALRKLTNEASSLLYAHELAIRHDHGNTNIECLSNRIDEARAVLAMIDKGEK